MDNLIFFIIIILLSILGSVGKIKKKRALEENSAQTPKKSSASRNDDFLGWLEKMTGEEEKQPIPYLEGTEKSYAHSEQTETEKKEPKTVSEDKNKTNAQYNCFISPEEKQKLMESEGTSVIRKNPKKDTPAVPPEGIQTRKTASIDFDLRKAVIYSEILNRKYDC